MSAASHEHHDDHVLPLKVYFGVFAALVFLTVVTVGVSYLDLGGPALIVAMVVACIKAALVVGYFMHLKFEGRFLSIIFFGSLIFVVLMFGFTFADLATRGEISPEEKNFSIRKEKEMEAFSAEVAKLKPAATAAPAK